MKRNGAAKEVDVGELPPLPSGWRWGKVGDAASAERNAIVDGPFGSNLKLSDYIPPPGVPVLTTANLRGDYSPDSVRYISKTKFQELRRSEVRAGDILVAKIGSCGLTGIYPADMPSAIIPANLLKMTVAADMSRKYVLYYLNSPIFGRFLRSIITATAQPAFNVSKFRLLPFPLAPLDEQERIVTEIEKQFTRLDAGVASLKRVQTALKRYRAGVLKAACEGQFPQEPISAAIRSLDQGWSPKCEAIPSPSNDVWAVIKTSAIQHGRFVEEENKRLPTALRPRPHLELQPGDLLITRAGPRTRAGVACLIKSTRPRLMLCDKAYRLRAKPDIAHPAFLEIVLNAPHIVDEIDELKTGISDSGVNLTQKRFSELLVPLPSVSEQTRIVADVERRLSVIEELETLISENLERATGLGQSILRRAFSGSM
jgi:type I restriction enzyme, S subunit